MFWEHMTSQMFFKNNKNILNNTLIVLFDRKFALIVSLVYIIF